MRHRRTALTLSRGIASSDGARRVLGVSSLVWRPAASARFLLGRRYQLVVGWGNRPSGVHGRRVAERLGIPYLGLEDGFLRSVDLGVDGSSPYALVIDDLGIYFDARCQSRLERILNGLPNAPLQVPGLSGAESARLDDPVLLSRARDCMAALVESRVSKYNFSPDVRLPPSRRPRVLVIDQRRGDCSIAGALADDARFRQMLHAARSEHPNAEVLIKTHPVTRSRRERGHFSTADQDRRTRLITDPCNPILLLEQIDRVYVVSSLMGFEALLVGVPVTCFGVPFYAGWGLTDDRLSRPRPRRRRRLEQVFAAAYLLYSRYLDPDTGSQCEIERVIEHLGLQRRMFAANAGRWIGYRIPLWKRPHLRRFLRSPSNRIEFVARPEAIAARQTPPTTQVLVWGMRQPRPLLERTAHLGYPVWHIEDGFLRSGRLGSDLSAPASWVFDRQGIYFNPRQSSDLETMLAREPFSAADLRRACALRLALVAAGISKYNVGGRASPDVSAAAGRRVILVPGQVPGDASLRFACAARASNAALLEHVRHAHPDAYILYKPHPDLTRGNRLGDSRPVDSAHYDQLILGVGIVPCLAVADEIHTLTSLVGFEALLRGLKVHTYCQPFYAGWGLTVDHAPQPRRGRRLCLDELVAAVLLRYPRYLNPVTGEFTSPEQVIAMLERAAESLERADTGSMLTRPLRLSRALAETLWFEASCAWAFAAGPGGRENR